SVAARCSFDDVWMFDGERPDHDAVGACVSPGIDHRGVVHAAGDLDAGACLVDDPAYDGVVDGPPLLGAVEVDDVDTRRALIDPALRHRDGVVAKDRLAGVVALDEPDA